MDKNSSRYHEIMKKLEERMTGDRAHFNLAIDLVPVRADGASMPRRAEMGAVRREANSYAFPMVYAHGLSHSLPTYPGGYAGMRQDGTRRHEPNLALS